MCQIYLQTFARPSSQLLGASVCPAPAALATTYSLDVKVNLD